MFKTGKETFKPYGGCPEKKMGELQDTNERIARYNEYRRFLNGGGASRTFFCLDPSSFASMYAGKQSGHPALDDLTAFHRDFPSDAGISIPVDFAHAIPQLRWQCKNVNTGANGTVYREETISTPSGSFIRISADRFGTTPWVVEPSIRSEDDFRLADFYAERIAENAGAIAESAASVPAMLKSKGIQPGATVLSAFELLNLIDYPDMPMFYMDWRDRYLASVEKMHRANLLLLEALAGIGVEMFYTGSAGLELLSPLIFEEAIVPFQREFNDRVRELGCFVIYHICGHSRQLIERKIIDRIKPTVFETCSEPPCGNNADLRKAVFGISEEIITKGNLPLELLLEGAPEQVAEAVEDIKKAVSGRRHIVGQADATILTGTPAENIRSFIKAADNEEG